MTAFLLATLYAPIASWGDITVGERRTTWDRPSRSAILGLVGAALGLDRANQDAHDALDQGFGVAVRVDAPGRPMSDYHTAQSLSQTEMKRSGATTRRQMMTHGQKHKNLETMLSRREYRVDAAYTIVLWQRGAARWSLQEVADALKAPAFVLYAGRKASPLAWPLSPKIVEADNVIAALATRVPLDDQSGEHWHQLRTGGFRKTNPAVSLSSDDDREFGVALGANDFRIEIRRDTSPNRTRWQFAERRQLTGQVTLPVARQPEEAQT
jgi:CRISPR system Cascade subunit CasD